MRTLPDSLAASFPLLLVSVLEEVQINPPAPTSNKNYLLCVSKQPATRLNLHQLFPCLEVSLITLLCKSFH